VIPLIMHPHLIESLARLGGFERRRRCTVCAVVWYVREFRMGGPAGEHPCDECWRELGAGG
jgi:hypothetical protein